MPIPKKLHYVWVGPNPIPARDQKFIKHWQTLNPDFELCRWDEKAIDLIRFPKVAQAIAAKKWALAADIIRMYVVYEEGGFYLDTDVELLKPLTPFLKYDAVAAWESPYWFMTAFFGAKKHSPWIKKILHRYELADATQKITTDTFLKTVHSPSVYAQDLFGLKPGGQTAVYGDNALAVFAPEYFAPKHYMTGELHCTENTVAIHHYASTWHTPIERIKNRLSRGAYHAFGPKTYAGFERAYHRKLERAIRRELP